MYKILLISISFFSLISVSYAQELPEYCTDNGQNITCEILILPYPSYSQDFDPGIAKIPSGATVIFKNTGFNVHTATSTDATPEQNSYYAQKDINGIFDTGKLIAGETAQSFTLNDPGEYHYLCTIHDSMRGTILVSEQSGIPDWVRNVFIWYGENKISEDEVLSAIKFLIDEGIIKI